jgi:hypothetical protein
MTILDSDPNVAGLPPDAPRSGWLLLLASPLGVVLLAVAGVLVIDAGGTDDGPGVCLFRRCTGGYCPGCGVTRSARHLTRGELAAAWQDHPFVLLAAAQATVAGAMWAVLRLVDRTIRWGRAMAVVGVINLVLLIGIWVVRLVDGSIPRFY